LAAFAPAVPDGVDAGCWPAGAWADWACGASGSESSCFCPAVLDWLDWDWLDCAGLAQRGAPLEIRNALASMAIKMRFEYPRHV
jgi:hypothetical protein